MIEEDRKLSKCGKIDRKIEDFANMSTMLSGFHQNIGRSRLNFADGREKERKLQKFPKYFV